MSEYLEIKGGVPLSGEVKIGGAKNAALPMLMAALMSNEGCILCLENIRKRLYKLQSVVKCLGASNIQMRLIDGRRYRLPSAEKLFDRIFYELSF